jgi:hypothetical protein
LQHVPDFFVDSSGTGFSFTAPADKTRRLLTVYLHSDEGRLTASLSDGSAPTFTDTGLGSGDLNTPGVYTIDYAAASAGQHLTVSFVLDHPDPAGFSVQPNVAIYAAALSRQIRCPDGFTPASASSFPSADRNDDGFVCVHAIDNHLPRK